MSDTSEKARAASKDKAERLVRADPKARVDASGYKPDGAMDADVITGMRPVSRRAYRRGGKVEGGATHHAGRKPRKSGGAALTADSLINRNVKEANAERGGITHDGGMNRGGRTHKMIGGGLSPMQQAAVKHKLGEAIGARPMLRASGGKVHKDEAQDRKLIHEMGCKCAKCHGGAVAKKAGGSVSSRAAINDGTRPVAGRLARKAGGRTKKGTTVNVIISQPPAGGAPAMPPRPMPGPPPGGMPPPGGVGLHQGAPPQAMAVPGAPVQQQPLMRKDGGSVVGKFEKPGRYPIKDGAGGGMGRMEKAKAYG